MSRLVGYVILVMFFLMGCALVGSGAELVETLAPAATDTPPATETPPQEDTPAVTEPAAASPDYRLAYLGQDGNLWILDRASGQHTQVTGDALPFRPGEPEPAETITYCCASWSSDGALLAYQREVGVELPDRLDVQSSIWAYDLASGQARPLLEGVRANGFDWRPGTHQLAYGRPFDEAYFMTRGSPDSALATGIWALDADTGAEVELVAPQRGYALVRPSWSPNGQFLGFDEVLYMEGRGPFAYYDFATQEYVAWEEAIGNYAWSADGSLLAYDRLTYTTSGEERIWWRERLGDAETLLTLVVGSEYAFNPLFSPAGDWLAYLVGDLALDLATPNTLFVARFPTGEVRELGTFDQVFVLGWTPDGSRIVLSVGPWDDQRVIEVSIADGSIVDLAVGSQPALAGGGK